MDRLDRSSVRRPPSVIIKHWVKQEPVHQSGPPPPDTAEDAATEQEPTAQAAPDLEALAREHAVKLIDNAQDTADALLATAQEEAEALRQTARDEGYEAGRQAAQEELQQQLQAMSADINEQFAALLQALYAREDKRDAQMEQNILRLSLEIAEKIVNVSLESDDMVFMGLVKEAVERLNAKDKFAIHLNQREYDRFFAEGSGWLHDAVQSAPFTVSVDASIAPGGLLLKSQEGTVRAGVDTQLDKLKHALLSQEDADDGPV